MITVASPRTDRFAIGIIVLAAAAGLAALPRLPAEMAIHWNAAGQADGTVPALLGVFLLPGLAAVLLGLFRIIPRIDPLGENFSRFRGAYDRFVLLLIGFLAYMQGVTLAWNLGHRFSMTAALIPAVAALYWTVGMVMREAEQNWFVGIRTPWTLSSEAVWDEVHRQAAPLFQVAGVVALVGLAFPGLQMVLLVGPVAAIAVYTTVLSYWLYRQEGPGDA